MVVDVNGVVGLVDMDGTASSYGFSGSDISSSEYEDQITVAAYWDDLEAHVDQAPEIRVADIMTNDMRYCVIEYRNIGFHATFENDADKATFQVVIPQSTTNSIFVQYLHLEDGFTGRSATVGFRGGAHMHVLVSYNEAGRISAGDVLSYSGLGSSLVAADTDGDGLNDSLEVNLGCSPSDPDTDHDGLPDGWEHGHGLNPLSSVGTDGADGDQDGDGLSNRQESLHSSNPNNADTDGDGLTDLGEIGGVVPISFPWLEFSDETDITGLFPSADDSCVKVPLAMSLTIEGVSVTNLTIDVNGLVYFHAPDYTGTIGSSPYPDDLESTCLNSDTMALAPFWNDMEIVTNHPASKILIGSASSGTNQYCLVEFRDMKTSAPTNLPLSRISFQVAIPRGGTDRVFARYGGALEGMLDSSDVRVGVQGFGGRRRHAYRSATSGVVRSGFSLAFVPGTGTSPSAVDTDGDGLSDSGELTSHTNPLQPDTDGDGLHDGWEVAVGYNPLVDNAADDDSSNDPGGDPDGDGLKNKDECTWDTHPLRVDTDGDGVSDSVEVAQSSDPADVSDEGRAGSRALVRVNFGDPSSSCSEKYRIVMSPVGSAGEGPSPRALEWVNAEYGKCEEVLAPLVRGVDYRVRMFHAGTIEEDRPDYDYRLTITPKPGTGVLIRDPDGLIAEFDDTSDVFAGSGKVAIIKVIDAALCADYDRNGVIDDADGRALKSGAILRHWLNDDDDDGDVAEPDSDDLEQGWSANHRNSRIDGRCDLLDFTPVHLDIRNVLDELGDYSGLTFKLVQADEAVKVAWTALTKSNARSFLTQDEVCYGPTLDTHAHESPVAHVKSSGVKIPRPFILQMAGNENKGVVLLEGVDPTTKPLRLEIYEKDRLCFSSEMPLSISLVEDMYRRVSLRNFVCPSSVSAPDNNPDAADAKNVVFLHGFNVDEEGARAWHAEMFKRLWQSGANMKFWGVTWKGDGGKVTKSYYHTNVQNALTTGDGLKTLVNTQLGTNTVVMAHSLGNMVVSRAIQKGMNVEKYFMFNAAIASEAFNGSLQNTSSANINFVPQAWRDYPSETWSARWNELFAGDPSDDRNLLKWKNQFTNILSKTTIYNYYSTGDEVFELSKDVPGMFTGVLYLDWPVINTEFPYVHFEDVISITLERHAWQKQECLKGVNFVAGTTTAGWAFHCIYDDQKEQMVPAYSPSDATNLVVTGSITNNPVFKRLPSEMFQSSIPQAKQDEIIAYAIPALSSPIGAVAIDNCSNVNFNEDPDSPNVLMRPNGWGRSDPVYGNRWLHSDIKDMAYYYVYKLFLDFRGRGGF